LIDNQNSEPVHDKLYKLNKEKQVKIQKQQEANKLIQQSQELEGCTFKPELISKTTVEKSISGGGSNTPKGFHETVSRLRNGILENLKKRFLVNK
jgi:hypothetical protein